MKNKIDKKKRREILSVPLLENPNMETQVKDRPYRLVGKIFVLSILLILLVISYIMKFSVNIYSNNISYHAISSFDVSTYYQLESCELLIVESYDDLSEAKEGDVVFFVTNTYKGSGLLVGFDEDVFELENNDGKVIRISERFVIGKQYDKVAVVGFIWAFLDSYIGIVILNVLLIAYIIYITFGRINYENTQDGKRLYKEYIDEKKELKNRKKLLEKVKDIDLVLTNLLDGDISEVKQKFQKFDYKAKVGVKEKYKHILSSLHEAYLIKETLTREEKRQITAVIELMFEPKDFDLDMEYMLIDLAQKAYLQGFDIETFKNNAIDFIEAEENMSDLVNFSSVFYVLVYQNSRVRRDEMLLVAHKLSEKASKIDSEDAILLRKVAESIIKIIKS